MSFYMNKDHHWYLGDTGIENIFINEYMVGAPGDYVKVYVFARMHAQLGSELSNAMVAMELGMEEEDVLKAWNYWESRGVVRKHRKAPDDRFNYDVEFLSLKEAGMKVSEIPEDRPAGSCFLEDEEVQGLFMALECQIGRPLSRDEMDHAADWMKEMGADPEVILYAYKQAQEKGIITSRYVGGIIRNWMDAGLKNAEDVENYLNDTSERRYQYRRVFKALGFERKWTEKEKRLMDTWFDAYGFTIDRVLEACDKSSGISNPNLNYINKILSNWNEQNEKEGSSSGNAAGRKISNSQILKYYESVREREETEAKQRKAEVFEKVPEIKGIEDSLAELNLAISKAMFGIADNQREQKIHEIREKMDALNVEKAFLLTDNNFTPDYMEIHYLCDICQDTGVTPDGMRCECFKERAEEAIQWQKSKK